VILFSPKISPILYSMVSGRPGRALLEAVEVGEELQVHEVAQIVAGQRGVVVELAVLALRRRPAFPAIRGIEDVGVWLPAESALHRFVLLQAIEVFQEKQPRGLLGVVELGGAAGFLAEDVVDVFEGLFEHEGASGGRVLGRTAVD
jgi:hypothetical protein